MPSPDESDMLKPPGRLGAAPIRPDGAAKPPLLEFFAGSGLVSRALSPYFETVWANDVCPVKARVFAANHPDVPFEPGSIADVRGRDLPEAAVSWASFPCQDLSLAGSRGGIHARRSGLVWEWLRVVDESPRRPPILAAENVVGLMSARGGANYLELHEALAARGYRSGAMVLDAVRWLPQSRPRVFVVAVDSSAAIPEGLSAEGPGWLHPPVARKAAEGLENWVWWSLPVPGGRSLALSDVVDLGLECHDEATSRKNVALIPENHLRFLESSKLGVFPGYKRVRNGKQALELRFDDVSGCLRTPSGGSSRQFLVIRRGGGLRTRLLSPREAARLMGAPEDYRLPEAFNDAYKAMGDAVAAPVAAYLGKHLLSPLAAALYRSSSRNVR